MKTTQSLLAATALLGLGLISSVQAQTLFFDGFNGSIDPAWQITRENTSFYTVNPTFLDLRASSGSLSGNQNNGYNVFLIATPTAGDFVVTLRLNSFDPVNQDYTQINLIAYDDDDNYVRSIYGHVFGARHLEYGKEVGGTLTTERTLHDFDDEAFYLRLTKEGNVYTQSYSTDGLAFYDVNSPITWGDGTPAYLGFTASDDPTQSSHAYIDSFTVTVPEPSAAALLMGAGAFAFARRRFCKA